MNLLTSLLAFKIVTFAITQESSLGMFYGTYKTMSPPPPTHIRVAIILTVGAEATLPYDYNFIKPALEAGYETALDLYNVEFEQILDLYQGGCNTSKAVAETYIAAKLQSVDLILGPGCTDDMLMSLEYQTSFNVSSITGAGNLADSTAKFPFVIRSAYNTKTQWDFFLRVCKKYSWTNIAIICDTTIDFQIINAESLTKLLRADTIMQLTSIRFNGTRVKDAEQTYRFLNDATKRSRIVVLLMSAKTLRLFMVAAGNRGETNGDYVYFALDPFRNEILGQDGSWKQGDKLDNDARKAYQSLLVLTLRNTDNVQSFKDFAATVQSTAADKFPDSPFLGLNYFVGAFYDAILIHARSINETLTAGKSIGKDNAAYLTDNACNRTFVGATGHVYINEDGDRNDDHSIYDMYENGTFYVAAEFFGYMTVEIPDYEFNETDEGFHWVNPTNTPPKNEPFCGFALDNPICDKTAQKLYASLGMLGVLLVVSLLVGFITTLVLKRKSGMAQLNLLGTWQEITKIQIATIRSATNSNLGSHTSLDGKAVMGKLAIHRYDTINAIFRGVRVVLRVGENNHVAIRAKVIREVIDARQLTNAGNILQLHGLCAGPVHVAVMYAYCSKGSLHDILAADLVKLDWLFQASFVRDIATGLEAIHGSVLGVHGRLTSKCCFVDGHFMTKIADYGLPSFFARTMPYAHDSIFCESLLWTAPELLDRPFEGATQEADVYSFAIILQEIIMREPPYSSFRLDPEVIIAHLQKRSSKSFRPKIDANRCPAEIAVLMRQCWANNPLERPRLAQIRSIIKESERNHRNQGNILDTLIQQMENHTVNLHRIIESKELELLHEREKGEQLLYQILPRSIVDQLKLGEEIKPEIFESVTVYHSDIVSFIAISSQSTPTEMVNLLNDLFIVFDNCVSKFDTYKVETFGDHYIVASGVPTRNGKQHVGEICRLALLVLNQIKVFKIRHRPSEHLRLRLGAHTGPCVTGVVGTVLPRYCLFGETVTIAAKMESTSMPMRIQISLECERILQTMGNFVTELRDKGVRINEKLEITTYWLQEEVIL